MKLENAKVGEQYVVKSIGKHAMGGFYKGDIVTVAEIVYGDVRPIHILNKNNWIYGWCRAKRLKKIKPEEKNEK